MKAQPRVRSFWQKLGEIFCFGDPNDTELMEFVEGDKTTRPKRAVRPRTNQSGTSNYSTISDESSGEYETTRSTVSDTTVTEIIQEKKKYERYEDPNGRYMKALNKARAKGTFIDETESIWNKYELHKTCGKWKDVLELEVMEIDKVMDYGNYELIKALYSIISYYTFFEINDYCYDPYVDYRDPNGKFKVWLRRDKTQSEIAASEKRTHSDIAEYADIEDNDTFQTTEESLSKLDDYSLVGEPSSEGDRTESDSIYYSENLSYKSDSVCSNNSMDVEDEDSGYSSSSNSYVNAVMKQLYGYDPEDLTESKSENSDENSTEGPSSGALTTTDELSSDNAESKGDDYPVDDISDHTLDDELFAPIVDEEPDQIDEVLSDFTIDEDIIEIGDVDENLVTLPVEVLNASPIEQQEEVDRIAIDISETLPEIIEEIQDNSTIYECPSRDFTDYEKKFLVLLSLCVHRDSKGQFSKSETPSPELDLVIEQNFDNIDSPIDRPTKKTTITVKKVARPKKLVNKRKEAQNRKSGKIMITKGRKLNKKQ